MPDYEEIAYDNGWMQTPPYGPRPSAWWREAHPGDERAERCYFGGPPVVWAHTAQEACDLDGLA